MLQLDWDPLAARGRSGCDKIRRCCVSITKSAPNVIIHNCCCTGPETILISLWTTPSVRWSLCKGGCHQHGSDYNWHEAETLEGCETYFINCHTLPRNYHLPFCLWYITEWMRSTGQTSLKIYERLNHRWFRQQEYYPRATYSNK